MQWWYGGTDTCQRRPGGQCRCLDKVGVDKNREAADGHDGTWVRICSGTVARTLFLC